MPLDPDSSSRKPTAQIRKRSLKKGESVSVTGVLPASFQLRLHELFGQIEKEFEALYLENLSLREKIEGYPPLGVLPPGHVFSPNVPFHSVPTGSGGPGPLDGTDGGGPLIGVSPSPGSLDTPQSTGSKSGSTKLKSGIPGQQKVALRLKAQTSRIVSSFKTNSYSCSLVREFIGHRDGVWDVCAGRTSNVLGTASADHRAGVFSMDTGKCLLRYDGHKGSCNSIRFHPFRELALSSSGDHSAHLWQCSVNWDNPSKNPSSEEELESSEKEVEGEEWAGHAAEPGAVGVTMRTPSVVLAGHQSVVICADFLPGGEQAITASWDRLAALWDTGTGERLQNFSGHDQELSFCASHPSQKLIVTTSKDATFRMWDLRTPPHSVSVFQGHTENVTSARFTKEDKLVSGSDDKTVKVWDIRNMRAALVTIRTDSSVNRLSISNAGLIAVPQDDRHVRIFDLAGQRVARLPRSNRQGHRRMVTSTAWTDDPKSHLLTSAFDRSVIAWSIQLNKDKEKD